MRILQVIQKKQYRGAEIFCCQLSNHLLDLGHSVEIVSIYDGDAILPFRKEVLCISGKRSQRFMDINGWYKLSKLVNSFKPDIIQANASDTLKYTVMSKITYGWKVPVIYRNANISSFFVRSKLSHILNSFLLRHVETVISVSESAKSDFNELFSFTTDRSKVIHIGIEKREITPFHFPAGSNVVHVGAFSKEKNHEGLLRIFREAQRKIPELKLHLVGAGTEMKKIKKKARIMNLHDSVYFLGGVGNPLKYIAGADLLVLPSTIEGFPAVLLEAMYCRTPVAAYNVGGVSEIVSKSTGMLVEEGNEKEFADKIVEILEETKEEKLEKAFSFVVKNCLNKDIALRFSQEYERLISEVNYKS